MVIGKRTLRTTLTIVALFLCLQGTLWWIAPPHGDTSNIQWWIALSTLMAERGIFHVWTPYPPLFPLLHLWLFSLVGTEDMAIVWNMLNAALLFGTAFLVFRLTRRIAGRKPSLMAAGSFLLFHLTWEGRIILGIPSDQFDLLPVFLLMLGAELLLAKRTMISAGTIALGAMTKIFPVLLAPLAVAVERGVRRKVLFTATVLLICSTIAAPFFLSNRPIFLATYQWMGERPGWESIWTYDPTKPDERPFPPVPSPEEMPDLFTLPFYSAVLTLKDGRLLPGHVIERRDEGLRFEFIGGERDTVPKEHIANLEELWQSGPIDRFLPFISIALLLGIAWTFRHVAASPEGLLRSLLLSLLIFLIFSKGVSSYYLLWFSPLIFVLYQPLTASILFSLFLVIGNIEFTGGIPDLPWFWPSIIARQMLFLGLALHQLQILLRLRRQDVTLIPAAVPIPETPKE